MSGSQEVSVGPEPEFGLEEIAASTGKTINVTRRNLEAYREFATLERDWLTQAEVEHLKRAIAFCEARKRPLSLGLETTKEAEPPQAASTGWSPLKRRENPANKPVPIEVPKPERANLTVMARELAQLRAIHLELRGEHERQRETFELTLRNLRVEGDYFPAWESRLRQTQEEVTALWDAFDRIERIVQSAAPRLEKVERRVGYSQRQAQVEPVLARAESKPDGRSKKSKSGQPLEPKDGPVCPVAP